MSHFPMYVSQNPNDMATPIEEQAWFSADQCEYSPDMDCEPPGWEPVPEASRFRFGASSSSKGLPHGCPPACPAHGFALSLDRPAADAALLVVLLKFNWLKSPVIS